MAETYGAKTAAFVLVLCVLFFALGRAEARVSSSPSWPAQELTGLVLSQKWKDLSPTERQRALKNFQRFQRLDPKQKRTLEQRYNRWRSLPPEERQRIRKNYERYQQLDSYEKEEFEELYRKWKSRTQGE